MKKNNLACSAPTCDPYLYFFCQILHLAQGAIKDKFPSGKANFPSINSLPVYCPRERNQSDLEGKFVYSVSLLLPGYFISRTWMDGEQRYSLKLRCHSVHYPMYSTLRGVSKRIGEIPCGITISQSTAESTKLLKYLQ
jgi:hypothetical protein